MKAKAVPIILTTTVLCCSLVHSFIHQPLNQNRRLPSSFSLFHKIFEESGPLGKGVTVGKVQVCLFTKDRSAQSIFKFLERKADSISSSASSATLARLANEVCLQLLRKQDDWTAACSESKWFSQNDAAKAESYFNELANREAAKFEKEYIKGSQSDDDGDSTLAVVSLVVEIEGDTTNFKGAGFSLTGTKEVLTSIASDSMVQGGECVNAVELFWTPGEVNEVLTSQDIILDFPELIDL